MSKKNLFKNLGKEAIRGGGEARPSLVKSEAREKKVYKLPIDLKQRLSEMRSPRITYTTISINTSLLEAVKAIGRRNSVDPPKRYGNLFHEMLEVYFLISDKVDIPLPIKYQSKGEKEGFKRNRGLTTVRIRKDILRRFYDLEKKEIDHSANELIHKALNTYIEVYDSYEVV